MNGNSTVRRWDGWRPGRGACRAARVRRIPGPARRHAAHRAPRTLHPDHPSTVAQERAKPASRRNGLSRRIRVNVLLGDPALARPRIVLADPVDRHGERA